MVTESATEARRAIAAFRNYEEAEAAVDRLSDLGFPVERITIVGRDLRLVEDVTGRFGYGESVLWGAASGAFSGLVIGWLFGALEWFDPIVPAGWLVVYGALAGALAGAVVGVFRHALSGGRRDFASVPALHAAWYELLVDEAFADEARELLEDVRARP